MKLRRGFSLLDLIVSIFLGSILAYIIALFFTGVVRQYFNINEKLNLSSQALSFRSVITRQLRYTTPNALIISPDGQKFGSQAFTGVEPPEKVRWSERYNFVAFDIKNQTLHAWSLPASSLGLNIDPSRPELPTLQGLEILSPPANVSPDHLLWRYATNFKATQEAQALRITLTFEQTGIRQNRHKIDFNEVYPLSNNREL